MKASEFNIKYKDFLKEGHYGYSLDGNQEVLNYLDNKFQQYIKIPGFKYTQIKSKFNWYCFYAEGISIEEREEVENNIKKIYNEQEKL